MLELLALVATTAAMRDTFRYLSSVRAAKASDQTPKGDRDYVLYLRAFDVDHELSRYDEMRGAHVLTTLAGHLAVPDRARVEETWEQRLIQPFARLGRVEAVGRPGEPLPPPGSRRFPL